MIKYELSQEQEEYILSHYYDMKSSELANILDLPKSKITNTWKKYGMHGKHRALYPIKNENYFETIDTPAKAYYIGFIAADGCVYKRSSLNPQGMISICISKEDAAILERLKMEIGTEKPLAYRNGKYVTLQISSDRLSQSLQNHGLNPRKTYGSTIPTGIQESLFRYFIRGYFDGDGSISKNLSADINETNVTIAGYSDNLLAIQNHLVAHNIFSTIVFDKRHYSKGQGTFGSLTFTNTICKYCFLRYLYEDEDAPFLERKHELAMHFINKVETDQRILPSKISQVYYDYAVQSVG